MDYNQIQSKDGQMSSTIESSWYTQEFTNISSWSWALLILRALTIFKMYIIFNNIQRKKPRLGVKLRGTWQGAVINECDVEEKCLLKWLAFNLKSFPNLFLVNIGCIKGI